MSNFDQVLKDLGLKKSNSKDGSQTKELKKLINSYIQVMTHQLGREPTPEEFFAAITGSDEDQSQDKPEKAQKSQDDNNIAQEDHALGALSALQTENSGVPEVLDTKAYFGVDENKNPDPRKLLYFEHPNGGVYDIHDGRWLQSKPEVLNHLPSRPIYHDDHDMMNLILHGIMNHGEYESLKGAGVLSKNAEKLWDMHSELQSKWHEINSVRSELQAQGIKTLDHQQDVTELLNIIDELQEKIHELEVSLQEMSPNHDFGEQYGEFTEGDSPEFSDWGDTDSLQEDTDQEIHRGNTLVLTRGNQ
jgi:hypothetical protein